MIVTKKGYYSVEITTHAIDRFIDRFDFKGSREQVEGRFKNLFRRSSFLPVAGRNRLEKYHLAGDVVFVEKNMSIVTVYRAEKDINGDIHVGAEVL